MTRAFLRLVMAAVLLLGLAVAPAAPATAAPRAASDYLAGCAQTGGTLSALFVLDRSGSLTGSDPEGIRYKALQVALEQLARMRSTGDSQLAVEAAVAAFDYSYFRVRDVVRWTRLDADAFDGDAEEQQDTVVEMVQMARANTAPAGGTNFEAAMAGVLSDMSDREGPGNCRVVFWFTDGKFESAADSVDAARARMCEPGGALDQIRQAGIALIGIQLHEDSSDLWPMAEGADPDGRTCGTVPIPSDWAPGIYLHAEDTAALKRIFGSLTDIIQGCTAADPDSKLIEPGIRRFRAIIDTPARISALRLDAPDGTVISAAAEGTAQAGGYEVSVQSDDHYVAFEVALPPGRGYGNWSFSTDPATTADDTSLCVLHDLHFELVDPDQQIVAGAAERVVVRAVASDGVATDLSVFADVAVGASAVGPDGNIRQASAQVQGGDLVVTLESLPTDPRVDLSLSMNLTTQSGLALTPVSGSIPLQLLMSKEFPVIRPADVLDLGTAVKTKPASAELNLMGSPEGPTRVCFGDFTSVSVPQEAAGTVPTVSDACVELQPSQSRNVTVSVEPTAAAEGAGSALLPITLNGAAASGQPSQDAEFELPVVWRFSDPLNAPVAVAVFLVVAAVSVTLPLLAMGLANLGSARFDIKGLEAGEVPVTISNDGIVRRVADVATGPGQVLDIYQDRDPTISVSNSRRFTIYGVEFKARGTLNPFGAPSFTAKAPAGHRIMSSVGIPIPGDREAPVSPGFGFVVLAVVSDADLASTAHTVPANLIFLLRDTTSFADRGLADRLMNQSMMWEKVSEEWRPDPSERVDPTYPDADSPAPHIALAPPDHDPFFD